MRQKEAITLAMTGASGVQYGLRLLEYLLQQGIPVDLMLSQPAQVVISMETEWSLPGRMREIEKVLTEKFNLSTGLLKLYGEKQWTASFASGSGVNRAMVVCPCTTGTLASIATGQSRSLMERAADVTLKERRKLLLLVRETPFSEIHLEHMLKLTRMGAVVMPANPGFYHQPQTVSDIIDFMVARILDHLDVAHDLMPVWGADDER